MRRLDRSIRKGIDGSEAASVSGNGGNAPSLCLSPNLTYAADTPKTQALIRSGRSTMVLSWAREARGREYRCP